MKKLIYLTLLSIYFISAATTSYGDEVEPSKNLDKSADQRAIAFGKIDKNGDGLVSRDEFAVYNHLSSPEPISDRDIRTNRIMAAFEVIDEDGDDRMSVREYVKFMNKNSG